MYKRQLLGRIDTSSGSKVPETQLREPLELMRGALLSGNAQAISQVGASLNNPGISGDGMHSVALLLAACQMGIDCSTSNPSYAGSCVSQGTCIEGERFEDMLQRNMGPERYAKVFALAADFRGAVERRDELALEKFIAPSPARP